VIAIPKDAKDPVSVVRVTTCVGSGLRAEKKATTKKRSGRDCETKSLAVWVLLLPP
jgi:hypothetical protein